MKALLGAGIVLAVLIGVIGFNVTRDTKNDGPAVLPTTIIKGGPANAG